MAMGTASYMSPEQVRGEKVDARTDLFSFGLVLYEMATGHQAFSGETAAMPRDAILNHAPVPVRQLNPELPAKLEEIIHKTLEKDRDLRYQSAAEIRTDLKRFKRDTDSGRSAATATVLGTTEPTSSTSRRKWKEWMPAVLALGLVISSVMLYWLTRPLPSPKVLSYTRLTNDGRGKASVVSTK
jgi:serine/threonine protein kinase